MAGITSQLDRAWSLLQHERYFEATAVAAAVLAHEPGNISATACRAMAAGMAGTDLGSALVDMEWAVTAAPRVPSLRHNYAMLLGQAGRVDEAATQYRAALSLKADDVQAFWGLSQNHRMSDEAGLVEAMASRFETFPAGPAKEFLAFALAKSFDDLKRPEDAIHFAGAAKRLSGRTWSPEATDRQIAELALARRSHVFDAATGSGHPTRLPLFIVGMPRSGTTLVETILSRHPGVLALGESRQIAEALDASRRVAGGPPKLWLGAGRDWIEARAGQIVGSWQRAPGAAPLALVTDKMPDNVFALGAITQLLPRARIVYVRRHPLDNGLSTYFTRFAHGNEFSNRLETIGLRARQVSAVMEFWKTTLDLPILDVHYERLVAEPETQIRRLAQFAELDWTDAFLTPEQAPGGARTASQWQVKQPIYRTSVARWKPYEPWLGRMIEAMGGMDWIEREASGASA